MDAVLTLLALVLFGWGLSGLIAPKKVRLHDRIRALSVLLSAFVVVALGATLFPVSGQKPDPAFFPSMAFCWAVIVGTLYFVRFSMRKAREQRMNPTRPSVREIWEQGKAERRETIAKLREDWRKVRAHEPAATPEVQLRIIEPSRSTSDYVMPGSADRDEWGTELRRSEGRPLVFEYASRQTGEITVRVLHDWIEYPRHVHGFEQGAGAALTFRKDKVIEWHSETNKLLRAPKGKSRQ